MTRPPLSLGGIPRTGGTPRAGPSPLQSACRAKGSTRLGHYDGGFDCRFYAKADSYSFVDMLGHLHLKHGKIIVFLDNASYHKSKMVNDFVDSYDGDIVLVYLPVYTPELNTTEGQWRLLRRATANVMYESTKVMKESIWTMLDRREVRITRMSGYLS